MGAGKREPDVVRGEGTMKSPQRGSRGAEMRQESKYFQGSRPRIASAPFTLNRQVSAVKGFCRTAKHYSTEEFILPHKQQKTSAIYAERTTYSQVR